MAGVNKKLAKLEARLVKEEHLRERMVTRVAVIEKRIAQINEKINFIKSWEIL